MTSSLLSWIESGEELESLSMGSDSVLLSSLMLITPATSVPCLGCLGCLARGLTADGHSIQRLDRKQQSKLRHTWLAILPESLRFLLFPGPFSPLCFSEGKCLTTRDWNTPLRTHKCVRTVAKLFVGLIKPSIWRISFCSWVISDVLNETFLAFRFVVSKNMFQYFCILIFVTKWEKQWDSSKTVWNESGYGTYT